MEFIKNTPKTPSAGKIIFTMSPGKRLVLFILLFILGFSISGAINQLIFKIAGESSKSFRIATILMDIFQMVIPALLFAVMITRQAASFLEIDRKFSINQLIMGAITMILAIPAMNWLIHFNEGIHLPESMAGIEQAMRSMEDMAQANVELVQGGAGIGDLIMSILIVGIFAGFCEELLFRGAFVRLLVSMKLNIHAAIWIVAFVFSALHFQFYGFFPRLLLGAFFGYAFYWSGSLWLPVVLHALNNIMYVVSRWLYLRGMTGTENIDSVGAADNWPYALLSLVVTALCLINFYRLRTKKSADKGASSAV